MTSIWLLAALVAVSTLARPVEERSVNEADLIAKLKTDGTRLEQFRDILTDGQDLLTGEDLAKASKFDFNTQWPVPGGEEGTVATAYADNFPILLDSGISFSIASLGPCGVFFPHVHPRANELFTVIEGQVSFGYMLESAVLPTDPNTIVKSIPPIIGKLTKFEGTLFPQGSIHYQLNDSEMCEKAVIVATLSSEDAGTTAVLQQQATDVGEGTRRVKGRQQAEIGDIEGYFDLLPPVIVEATKKCLARCRA